MNIIYQGSKRCYTKNYGSTILVIEKTKSVFPLLIFFFSRESVSSSHVSCLLNGYKHSSIPILMMVFTWSPTVPRSPAVPGSLSPPCSPGLGGSLLDETEEAVEPDQGVALLGSPVWVPLPLLSDAGVLRGVRIRKVAGCRRKGTGSGRHFSSSPPTPTCPRAPHSPGAGLVWVSGGCAVCGRKQQVNSNLVKEICERCLSEIFPFNFLTNDRQFRETVKCFFEDKRHLEKASQLLFNPLCEEK